MAAWRYEICLLVLKNTRSLRSIVKYFSTLEEKFRISARPCYIIYLFIYQADICSYSYGALLAKFQPGVLNPLVLICGCLLYLLVAGLTFNRTWRNGHL